jgi:SNF2 family DNA or RNA helicase
MKTSLLESDDVTLVYDKYSGKSHKYDNPETLKIGIKEIYENGEMFSSGKNAIEQFNNMFPENMWIQNDINFDVIDIQLFRIGEIIITLVIIDQEKMQIYFDKNNSVPNYDFLIKACTYHLSYKKKMECENYVTLDQISKNVIQPSKSISDPLISNPYFLNAELFKYQKRTIHWMLDIEKKKVKLFNENNEILIGNLMYDQYTKKFKKSKENMIKFSGGLLADEVGLGKTVQMITLSLLNRATYPDFLKSKKMFRSRATLIICPNQLCKQWENEIKKMVNYQVDVKIIISKKKFDECSYIDIIDADFVITSFNFLEGKVFCQKLFGDLTDMNTYLTSKIYSDDVARKYIQEKSLNIIKNPKSLHDKNPLFCCIYWHRIIIDEYHEILTIDKYLGTKRIIKNIKSKYRWIVTGTPFNKRTNFNDMIGYITDSDITLENVTKNCALHEQLVNNVVKRNTKESIHNELQLPKLSEKIIWLKFSKTEWTIYNAYAFDDTVETDILIKICSGIKIVDKIREMISSTESSDEIIEKMIIHYKKEYVKQLKITMKNRDSLLMALTGKVMDKIKTQCKILKENGHNVKIKKNEHEFIFNNFRKEYEIQLDIGDEREEDGGDEEDEDEDEDEYIIEIEKNTYSEKDENIMDKKETMIIDSTEECQKKINKLIPKKIGKMKYENVTLEKIIKLRERKLEKDKKNLHGKKCSYIFYVNVMETIRKMKDCDDEYMCGICLNDIKNDDIGITICGHIFCHSCIIVYHKTNKKCPVCSRILEERNISLINFYISKKNDSMCGNVNNALKIEKNNDLVSEIGTKMTNLLYYLKSIDDHVIIFSQWNYLLMEAGKVLEQYGIKNLFCNGNIWMKESAINKFNSSDEYRVIMLSSDCATAGINLTRATKVIMLDPIQGELKYRMDAEWQAIGRTYRIGQNKPVEIVRFLVKGTIEEKIYTENMKNIDESLQPYNIQEITDDEIKISDIAIEELIKQTQKEEKIIKTKNKNIPKMKKQILRNN